MKQIAVILVAVFALTLGVGIPLSEAMPLQKLVLKVEGVKGKSDIHRISKALLSMPGVKKVDPRIKRRWLIFKDYSTTRFVVEFEQGTLTSETLIQAVERSSHLTAIYKAKFVE